MNSMDGFNKEGKCAVICQNCLKPIYGEDVGEALVNEGTHRAKCMNETKEEILDWRQKQEPLHWEQKREIISLCERIIKILCEAK
jgi:hypothetical protein